MKDTVNKLRIDLDRQKTRTSVSICKGDTLSRTIYVTLLNSGCVFDIPDSAIATLLAKKPDGKIVYNDCVTNGNEISFTITNQLIAVAGDIECQIKVTCDDKVITSPVFLIRVYERLFDETILESTNDYSALQTYCSRAEKAAAKIDETIGNISESIKAIASECDETRKVADSAIMAKEYTGRVICVKSPYSVVMVTNVKGVTTYEGIPSQDDPIDPVCLAEKGKISINVSTTKEMDSIIETYTIEPVWNLRSVGNYADELCFKNKEMYVRRRIKAITLTEENITEMDIYSGTSFEGKRYAYRISVPDAIKNPSGVWYTCNRFRYELVQLNASPDIGVAVQNYPGYFVLTSDMHIQNFMQYVSTFDVDILYVAEEYTTNEVLDVNGILNYEHADTVYIAAECNEAGDMDEITVQVPECDFADAVMQLL